MSRFMAPPGTGPGPQELTSLAQWAQSQQGIEEPGTSIFQAKLHTNGTGDARRAGRGTPGVQGPPLTQ